MKKLFNFTTMVFLSALFITVSAVAFSVTGIAKLFAGASLSVIIMAMSLEVGKVVSVSFLYRYWNEIGRTLKAYLLSASAILMLITSIGIYGFLTAAYQQTADKLSILDQQSSILTLQKQRYQDQLNLYIPERDRLGTTIQELSRGLANNVIQYRDSTTGQILTSTSSGTRTALQRQLNLASEERTAVSRKIESLTDSITSLDIQALAASSNNELAAEVGPLRFIVGITGWRMDTVVNIFTLMIVFVLDPLAIALIIGFNFLIKRDGTGTLYTVYGDTAKSVEANDSPQVDKEHQEPVQESQEASQDELEQPQPPSAPPLRPTIQLRGIHN